MNVLIVAHFTRDFSANDNGRFLYIAKMLVEKHHEVEIVTTKFSHGAKAPKKPITIQYPFKITMLDEPGYKKNICFRRFYSHYRWGKALRDYLKTIKKPDVVYCAVPSLTGPNYVAQYCKDNNIKFVVDIQDLWPEAFRMVFSFPILSDIVFMPFQMLANSIYKSADSICAVSQSYVNRALKVNKKCKIGTTVFLGTNLDTFDYFASEEPIMMKENNEIWLAYCGTLGGSYDLTCVIDALDILAHKNIKPNFIIMGDGPRRKEFEEYAYSKDINVKFMGYLPYKQMCSLLCRCDIAVNPIIHKAAASIINKHGDYAASGLPVVSTQENEEYRKLVDDYQMGFNCRNNNAIDVAKKIEKLICDEDLRKQMGLNARRCAEEKFDRKNSYNSLLTVILGN